MTARENQSNESSSNHGESKFAKHTQSDPALAPDSGNAEVKERKGLSWSGKDSSISLGRRILSSTVS
jgi:hypothetical protein